MLDQPYMTDLIEANSMGHEPNLIDIYSASWGPTDDGKTVDGPRNATMRAIVRGVNEVCKNELVYERTLLCCNLVVTINCYDWQDCDNFSQHCVKLVNSFGT